MAAPLLLARLICRWRGHAKETLWFARDGYHVRRLGCARCHAQIAL